MSATKLTSLSFVNQRRYVIAAAHAGAGAIEQCATIAMAHTKGSKLKTQTVTRQINLKMSAAHHWNW